MDTASFLKPPDTVPLRVLVVDDEKNIRVTLAAYLEGMGCRVMAVATAGAALSALESQAFDLAFLDLRLKEMSGLELLPQLLSRSPRLAVVMITAYATIDTAVAAIKRGARDYLPKPFTPEQIGHLVSGLAERLHLSRQVAELQAHLQEAVPEVVLETESPKMRSVLEMVERVAPAEISVLLLGENGTGKGVIARWLHSRSRRSGGPFVVISCPTLSEELLASELFGHVKGAFTGATRDREGRLEAAQGGTVFLDEVSEISPGLQAKLLRFLQEKQFERVGENRTRRADVRVVAATNRYLEEEVKAGRFREDLFFRLNTVQISLPPLRERREDIPFLARRFLDFFARQARRPTPELSISALDALRSYSWPGNIRELRNVLERAVILWPSQVMGPEAFPEQIAGQVSAAPVLGGNYSLERIEREHILRVLARTSTLEEAAQILGIDSSTLWRKRKKYEEES
ncbi:MAG: sigma-54 dependent transcriptional regulator [Syntrophales bacterium]|nr:sigma-54 dependent transcriptional regulator [Syntrophales bacterium]MDD5642152.1 sigma-54 dependent transcriptional regulator [Syntrophales bacterium]